MGRLAGEEQGVDAWEAAFADPAGARPAARELRAEHAAVGAELLAGLNPAQAEAVQHGGGPLLILAGAGSGKTRVITRRIGWLIRERGVPATGVLAITFTNKAAGEMRARVAGLDVPAGAWISTFHSACARILRRDIELLAPFTRDFTIYDTDDRNRLIRDLIKDAGFDTTRFKPAAIGSWISQVKNARHAAGDDGSVEGEVLSRVLADYERALAKNDALDFDDLLLKVLELFERHPGTRDGYARRFEHVLVDEYQDTNGIQYDLLRHLSAFHGNLTVCGDPDQSIYAWRGADVGNILDFESDFPGAVVVRLEQNYRSTQNILGAAQGLIRHNQRRKEKELWSAGPAGEPLEVIECADEDDEAREIAAQIRALVARGRRGDEAAIFYRVNFMQRALERALRLASVPYRIVAGVEFFQRREIKDLVAYLRLLVNPRDDEAFLRAVNVPQRGIGEKSLEQLAAWAAERGLALLAASGADGLGEVVRGRARSGLAGFSALIGELAPLRDGPASVALTAVIAATGYEAWLAKFSEGDEVDRQANVDELLANAETYDRAEPAGGLRGFLQDIALVSDADAPEDGGPRVSLMTLHTAKGLEFPFVFLAGLEEELLPHARAIEEAWGGSDAGVEEERRLTYVGMTRAKERLFLTHARVRRHFGAEQFCRPSRFLSELPPELIAGSKNSDDEAAELLGEFDVGAGQDLREGDLVMHSHFGRGLIQALLGAGINARATVDFEQHGRKQLLLQYARLEVIERGRA